MHKTNTHFAGLLAAILGLGLLVSSAVQATIILSDDFNAENGGNGVLNYTGFSNWTVSDGSVDLIGNGYFDLQPGNGLYLDMDGSTSNAGKLTSASFALAAGTYQLSFDLAGNQRNAAAEFVDVQVAMGAIYSEIFSLNIYDPFTTFTRTFTLGAATTASISFEGAGGDNLGMLLDNIVFQSVDSNTVPEPTSLALLGLSLCGVGLARKRKIKGRG